VHLAVPVVHIVLEFMAQSKTAFPKMEYFEPELLQFFKTNLAKSSSV